MTPHSLQVRFPFFLLFLALNLREISQKYLFWELVEGRLEQFDMLFAKLCRMLYAGKNKMKKKMPTIKPTYQQLLIRSNRGCTRIWYTTGMLVRLHQLPSSTKAHSAPLPTSSVPSVHSQLPPTITFFFLVRQFTRYLFNWIIINQSFPFQNSAG